MPSTLSRRSFLATAAVTPALALTQPTMASARTAEQAKFKLGLVSYNVSKDWDLPTTLDICKRVGIAAVECRTSHKHGVEPSLNTAKRAETKKRFADSGVVFWGSGTICEFQSDSEAVVRQNIETCKSFVGLVAELGGKGVKVRPNGVAKGMPVAKACQQIGKALIECGKAASDAGIEIWVEVHGAVTQDPKNMKTIMETCGHPTVGVTWNSNDGEVVNGSLTQSFDLLSKYIRSCHINDLEKDKLGTYPYRELFKKLKGMADPRLQEIAYEFHWLRRMSIGFAAKKFRQAGVQRMTFAGKFQKHVLFRPWRWLQMLPDWRTFRLWQKLRNKNRADDSIMHAIIDDFLRDGIHCVSALDLCPGLLVREGILTKRKPTANEERDIEFGWSLAKQMGGLDVGQSVAVRERAVLAVEAIEGTDRCILRAGELCGQTPFTVVKVAKPNQDMRFDVPTVGPTTIESMRKSGGKVLAIEAGKTIIIDELETIAQADRYGMTLVSLQNPLGAKS